MSSDPFSLRSYTVRRKILKLLGGGFYILDSSERVVGYSEQKAFKLKEDIRLFAEEAQTTPLLRIQARQVIDFGASYDIVDARDNVKVGCARRKGLKSILRDSWELCDENDVPLGKLEEDSMGGAILRRLINIIPQTFHIGEGAGRVVLKQRWNPFVYKLDVTVPANPAVDPRLVMGAAILIAAIEGRQE